MMKNILNCLKKDYKKEFLIFISFFIIYVFLGLCISYNANYDTNLFFGADNVRAFSDLTSISYSHYRIKVHPLFLIFFETVTLLLNGFTNNLSLAVIIEEALCGSLSVLTFYFILKNHRVEKRISIIFSLIYGFSFSMIIFSTIPETFIFANLGLILYWYFISISYNKKEPLSKKEIFILVFFGIFSFGITLTNYFSYSIGLIVLLFNRYDLKRCVKKIFSLNVLNGILIYILCYVQKFIWKQAPLFWQSMITGYQNSNYEELKYMNWTINIDKIYTWIKQTLIYPLASSDITIYYVNESLHPINFTKYQTIFMKLLMIFVIAFMISCVFIKLIKCIKNFKKNDLFLFGLFITFCGNGALHFIYGSREVFIYSPHYYFLFLLLAALSMDLFKDHLKFKKAIIVGLAIVCAVLFFDNTYYFFKTAKVALNTVGKSINFVKAIKGTILISAITFCVILCKKYMTHRKDKTHEFNEQLFTIDSLFIWIVKYIVLIFIVGLFIAYSY